MVIWMGDGGKHRDFFVSYNRHDRAWAEWVAWVLEEAGYSVYVQAWDFRPGSNFVSDMQKAAIHSARTVALLSDNYFQSDYAEKEWTAAMAKGKKALVPIRVARCQPEGLFAPLTYIDLVGLSEQAARDSLLGGFKGAGPTHPLPAGVEAERVKPAAAPRFPGDATAAVQTVALAAPPPTAARRLTPDEMRELPGRLGVISPAIFNILVSTLAPPEGTVPPMPAPQPVRARPARLGRRPAGLRAGVR